MMETVRYALTPIEEKPPQKRASHVPPGVLRKCTVCGKEARNEEDLEKLMKRKEAPYGRANLCKDCHNTNSRLKKKEEWR